METVPRCLGCSQCDDPPDQFVKLCVVLHQRPPIDAKIAEQAQVQLTFGRNPQVIATGAKILRIGRNDADPATPARRGEFDGGTSPGLARQPLPATGGPSIDPAGQMQSPVGGFHQPKDRSAPPPASDGRRAGNSCIGSYRRRSATAAGTRTAVHGYRAAQGSSYCTIAPSAPPSVTPLTPACSAKIEMYCAVARR